LSVVPDRSGGNGSCLEFLTRRELHARSSKPPSEYRRLRVVHRIDRWTSGLVMVAKTPVAERKIAADFEARRMRKEYLAIVSGSVEPARVVVDCPVGPGRKGKMRAVTGGDRGGKAARTTFDVLERYGDLTLVSARPDTGRQHQIRVHAWVMGHPLAIDSLYAVGPDACGGPLVGIDRLTLHAYCYTLPPDWDEPRRFCCPPAMDFRRALDALRRAKPEAAAD
jgi:23S rRNA pseudouridine1911/1915/1917 synthase